MHVTIRTTAIAAVCSLCLAAGVDSRNMPVTPSMTRPLSLVSRSELLAPPSLPSPLLAQAGAVRAAPAADSTVFSTPSSTPTIVNVADAVNAAAAQTVNAAVRSVTAPVTAADDPPPDPDQTVPPFPSPAYFAQLGFAIFHVLILPITVTVQALIGNPNDIPLVIGKAVTDLSNLLGAIGITLPTTVSGADAQASKALVATAADVREPGTRKTAPAGAKLAVPAVEEVKTPVVKAPTVIPDVKESAVTPGAKGPTVAPDAKASTSPVIESAAPEVKEAGAPVVKESTAPVEHPSVKPLAPKPLIKLPAATTKVGTVDGGVRGTATKPREKTASPIGGKPESDTSTGKSSPGKGHAPVGAPVAVDGASGAKPLREKDNAPSTAGKPESGSPSSPGNSHAGGVR